MLNHAVHSSGMMLASEILDELNAGIKRELHKNGENEEVQDGMDICIIDKKTKSLQYARANNPFYILRNNEIIQIKANKFSIGLMVGNLNMSFQNNNVLLEDGDIVYMFSDGYADQIGENGDEKFMYSRFRKLLISIQNESMDTQKNLLDESISKWVNNLVQLDDILVIDFKV